MAGILSDMSQGILGVLRKNNPRLAGILGAATDPQFYKDTASNLAHVPVGMTAAAIGAPADIMSMGSNFKPGEMPLSTDWLLKRWYAGRNEGVPETARIASMLPNDASDVGRLSPHLATLVWHGTPAKGIKSLDPRKAVETPGAVFFNDNKDVAEIFRYPREYGEVLFDAPRGSLIKADVNFKNPLELTGKEAQRFTDDTAFQGQIVRKAKSDGHDGIIVRDVKEGVGDVVEHGTTYVAFDPSTYKVLSGLKRAKPQGQENFPGNEGILKILKRE